MNRFSTGITLLGSITMIAIASGRLAAQGGQVGYPPATSPYVDLPFAQEFTFFAGQYYAHRDIANVGPGSGMVSGVHYEWRPTGPLHLIGELSYINSDRRLINPLIAEPGRELGSAARPLYAADFGLGLGLTGEKSWHRLVPEISGGIGLISDLRSQPDSGGFLFGTRFSPSFGAGIRYIPGGKWQIRADLKDRLYTISYPQTFFTAPAGGTAVVTSDKKSSYWLNNFAYTLGVSYLF